MVTIARIVAIIAVFAGACIGWGILGASTYSRTSSQAARLGPEVQSLWGHVPPGIGLPQKWGGDGKRALVLPTSRPCEEGL